MAKFIREEAELGRAVEEVRSTLSGLARSESLPACLMSLSTLIDRTAIGISGTPGASAFELDEQAKTIKFRAATLSDIMERAERLAAEAGLSRGPETVRMAQVSINLFVVHELMHVQQNFPDFATVQQIKLGMPYLGLPMLDVGADTAAAWVCARIEATKTSFNDPDDILRLYVNSLVHAYLLGAFVFNVVDRREKKQRALGLIFSAVLVQAKVDGTLAEDRLYNNWEPGSPLMAFDLAAADAFNAIVLDRMPGLLLQDRGTVSGKLISKIWNGIGKAPVGETLQLVAEAFILTGAIVPGNTKRQTSPARRAGSAPTS
ncbi:hypothetical protein [Phenylobacterium sp.]|uniref:hypothetical protein n=1 Tax=Phenylobacterium sp. TaxID=1871053 RepID=UPI00271F460F|nr:hypothetical protein [Phenylobacterium sp.]MDO8377488.1 hypothetical protein [Phenylobacterium sp.]